MASERDSKGKSRVPLLESISAGIGLALLLGMFVFLAYEAFKKDDGVPPVMAVVPTAMSKAGGQYIVELEVSNQSRRTAAAVQVEGVLKQGGSEVETSSASFDYVPGKSERRGGIVFTRDPRKHRLQLRVTGYENP